MPETTKLNDPWLVAAWPGIGNVAVGAAAYLVDQLAANLTHEFPAGEFFPLNHVEVERGVASAPALPRSMLFEWKSAETKHDLLIFLGEAQPPSGGHTLCRRIIDYAAGRDVTRVFTFAAMATQLHPSASPRVFGAVTQEGLLPLLREFEVETLEDGQIGGLNGLLLAAAVERGLPGACLLGELPFFAAGVQNPKASTAVLEVFTRLAGVEIDFGQIREAGEQVEAAILDLLEKMKEAVQQQRGEEDEAPGFAAERHEDGPEPTPKSAEAVLDEADRARIEALFKKAHQDRSAAFQLKEELDRLGVFDRYEDRFLDLFKRAE